MTASEVVVVVGVGVVAMGAAVFVGVVVVVDFDFAGGPRAWTRQAPWYVPCGEAVCIVCREFLARVHASLNVFRQKPLDVYIIYLCPKRGQKLRLYQKQRQHV